MIRLRPSRGEGRVFLRWKEVPVRMPNAQWGQIHQNIGDWSRERLLARPCKETRLLMPVSNLLFSAPQSVLVAQSCLTLCDPWTVAHQAPLSVGFSKQEYWSGLPCASLGDLPPPGIESASLMSPALAEKLVTTSATWEAPPTG